MKSPVVDENLSSIQLFCSWEDQIATRLIQQNEKSTQGPFLSFVEKTSVKQDPKPQVCYNFQMSFLHLIQMDPP